MAARRRVIEIAISEEDRGRLETINRSRTEPACRVERARMLLAYCADPSTYGVGAALGVTHQTVQRCLMRAVRLGVMTALDDSPRPGKAAEITPDARAWLVSLACQKPKDLGYPHELWTTQLLASHARTCVPWCRRHASIASMQSGVQKMKRFTSFTNQLSLDSSHSRLRSSFAIARDGARPSLRTADVRTAS